MPYVKIPDPSIIDLAAWNQVISVVNQHSDSIAALTNDFGTNYEPVWDTDDNYSVQFDATSQKIVYGRAMLKSTDTNLNEKTWYEAVTFSSPFSNIPIVTATVLLGNSEGVTAGKYPESIVAVYRVNADGFNYRVRLNEPLLADKNIWINWMAIGPR